MLQVLCYSSDGYGYCPSQLLKSHHAMPCVTTAIRVRFRLDHLHAYLVLGSGQPWRRPVELHTAVVDSDRKWEAEACCSSDNRWDLAHSCSCNHRVVAGSWNTCRSGEGMHIWGRPAPSYVC